MTNREKFREVFGYTPYKQAECLVPHRVCDDNDNKCSKCPFNNWWDKEYKPCFEMREEGDQITNPESHVCECWEEKRETDDN